MAVQADFCVGDRFTMWVPAKRTLLDKLLMRKPRLVQKTYEVRATS